MSWIPYHVVPHLSKPYPPKLRDMYGRSVYGPTSCRLDYASERAYQGWRAECESIDHFNYQMEKKQKDKGISELVEMMHEKLESEQMMAAASFSKPKIFKPKNKFLSKEDE